MEEKIKEIVSVFIKVPAEQIGGGTAIGRTAVQSSILLHRMYARLEEAGVVVDDYSDIKVFGDLMRRWAVNGDIAGGGSNGLVGGAADMPRREIDFAGSGVGIDIEEVAALPRVSDLRKAAFYTRNFTAAEIAYCILQVDPYASLTGLFAAKEAIVKADGQYRHRPFHQVEIGHTAEGKPEHPGFSLSISHAGGLAVAVAVRAAGELAQAATPVSFLPMPAGGKQGFAAWIGWMALLLAAAALLIALKR